MGYRRVSFDVDWRGHPVGCFHQRLSDVRWLVGTFEPSDHPSARRFIEIVKSLPLDNDEQLLARGVPVSYAKEGGKSRSRMGLVQYYGPPRILKKDITEEMLLCMFNHYEILDMLAKQSDFVWVQGDNKS